MSLAPQVRFTWLTCAAALSVAVAASAAVHAPAGDAKTLRRVHDPIVVSGRTIPPLVGRDTGALRLMRIERGRPVPMPYQFDERDRRGELIVDGPPTFRFGDADELVFMAVDTGDRAVADVWPPGCDTVVEIAVIDPRDDATGWAYALHCPAEAAPAVSREYVSYDPRRNEARSDFYETAYATGRNYFTGLRLADGDGAFGENLLRQTAMRGVPTFSMLFTTMQFEFTEQNSIVRIDGVKNGPVRAIRKVRLSVDLGALLPDLPNGTVYTYHYRTSYVTPTRFGIPGLALRLLRDFRFEAVLDFAPQATPLRYWDAAHPDGIPLLVAGDAPITSAMDHDWWVHSNEHGAMLHAFIIPEQWTRWGIARGAVVRDGAAGYSLLNMTRLRQGGDYDLLQAAIVLPHPYRPGDEMEPMAMLHAPLRTQIRRLR